MPEDIVQACHENEAMDAQPLNGCQFVWMAHWKNTNYNSATQGNNDFSIDCESGREVREDSVAKQDNVQGRSDVAIDVSTSTGAIREATKAAKVSIMENLPENPGNLRIGSLDFKSFPISEKRDGTLSLKGEQCAIYHREALKTQTDISIRNNIASPRKTEIYLQSERFLPMNSSNAIEKNRLTVSTPVWSDVKSTSEMVPIANNKGRSSMPFFAHGQHEIYQSSYKLASREHFTSTDHQTYSPLLIREKKRSNLLDPQTSGFSRLMSSGPDLAPYELSATRGGLNFVSEHNWKMQHYTGTARFSSLTSPFESSKVDDFCHGNSAALQMPSSVHDAETMKIFTTPIESGEESPRGHPKIYQTTYHFPMSENSDIILSEKGQLFRESEITTKFKRSALNVIPYFSQPTGDSALGSVKVKTLGSSVNREGKKSVQNLENMTMLKNESSAETDTMDINALQEDQHPCDVTLSSTKCPKESPNSSTWPGATTSAREGTKAEPVNVAIHDADQESLKLHTLTGPVDERETSTSKTQSLDVEHLLSHANEHRNSKSSTCGNGPFGSEPSSRWLKRLKLSTSDSALGTKSEKLGETSCHENVHMIFSKIMKGRKTSLEPKITSPSEGLNLPDLPAIVSSNVRPSFVKSNQTVDAALSHPWIQRWSHNPAASSPTKDDTMDLEPVMEGFQKKQFPSIAAMALMGKAMGSLRPCKLMKKGPLVIWKEKL
ncbi:hypothetical protein K1719_000995 [Acacia pycnantha]|nr:hypothetical protein K1719_000995 [Acacia pycnantha]